MSVISIILSIRGYMLGFAIFRNKLLTIWLYMIKLKTSKFIIHYVIQSIQYNKLI